MQAKACAFLQKLISYLLLSQPFVAARNRLLRANLHLVVGQRSELCLHVFRHIAGDG